MTIYTVYYTRPVLMLFQLVCEITKLVNTEPWGLLLIIGYLHYIQMKLMKVLKYGWIPLLMPEKVIILSKQVFPSVV